MAIDRAEIAKLHAEAKRIRTNFRYIQKDLKRAPQNIDLLRQRDHLKKRYAQIQDLLHDARETEKALPESPDENSDANPVDMSIFEPKPFEVPPAVYVGQSASARGGGLGINLSAKDLRTIISVALLVVVVPFFYLYFVKGMRFYEVPSRSMEPALMPGDRIMSVRPSVYERGDIVVIPDAANPGDYLVKRLVAFGGDTVEIANGNLFVNGQPISEPYVAEPMEASQKPKPVPEGDVYLLGDNRNNSEDSRAWGAKPLDSLMGRVTWIYSPASRRGAIADQSAAFRDVPSP